MDFGPIILDAGPPEHGESNSQGAIWRTVSRFMTRDLRLHGNRRSLIPLVAGALIAVSGQYAPCQICSISSVPSVTQPFMAAPSEQMLAYEVATIKPLEPNQFGPSLRVYIQRAFGISPNTLGSIIGPDWINSTRYVINGKPSDRILEAMQTMPLAERTKENDLMMQALLADRFRLKAHFETREMPVYELVPAKGGTKLKDADPTKHGFRMNSNGLRGSVTIHDLTDFLECSPDVGGREVIDKTGLAGVYDVSLTWTPLQTGAASGGGGGPAPLSDAEGASLFTAIEEQLGLKLVSIKAPAQVLVIDHIEKPSAN